MRYAIVSLLGLALSAPIMIGCDREVQHSEKTSENPITGTQTTKDQTTYQRPDGSTYTNSSKSTNTNPNNPPPP
jgi:hypothetical protein